MRAEILSVNVGLPRIVMSHGDSVLTGIFKEPVPGRVMLTTVNLDGDRQADLSVHGGPSKAVYVSVRTLRLLETRIPRDETALGHVR
jgi:MOSC domain-containing protein YiiM